MNRLLLLRRSTLRPAAPPPPPPPDLVYGQAAATGGGTATAAGTVTPLTPQAGALPVGDAVYDIPAGAVFVDPVNGSNTNAGTEAAPYQTIVKAFQVKAAGGTIVLREGNYPESLNVANSARVYLQNYPGEAAWIDGTNVVGGSWTDLGSGVYSTTYTTSFPRFSTSGYNGDDPLRNHVDQVFVNGTALTQVADNTTPAAGQFSVHGTGTGVNWAAATLRVRLADSSTPTGKEVRYTARQTGLICSGSPVTVRGIGFRRHSPASISQINAPVYLGGSSHGSLFENVVIQQSAMAGLNIIKDNVEVYNCTIQDCGQTGVHGASADGLVMRRNHVRRCNRGRWQTEPTTSGVKFTTTRGATFSDNIVEDVWQAKHIWFDVSCLDIICTNNKVVGPSQYIGSTVGLLVELSDGGNLSSVQHYSVFCGNRFSGLASGIQNYDSGYGYYTHNEFTDCRYSLYVWQDNRFRTSTDTAGGSTVAEARWVAEHVTIDNNVVTSPMTALGSPIQMLVYDQAGQSGRATWHATFYPTGVPDATAVPNMTGIGMLDHFGANTFATATGTMIQLGTTTADVRTSFNSPAALAAAGSTVGGPWDTKYTTCYQGSPPADSAAVPMPAVVAAAFGLPTGTQVIGAPLAAPVAVT